MTTIETTKREGPLPVLRVSDTDTHSQVMSGARNRAMSPALFATQLLNIGLRSLAGPKSAPEAPPVDPEQPYASFPKGARMLLELRDEEIEELMAEVERLKASGPATDAVPARPATAPPPSTDAADDRAALLSRAFRGLTIRVGKDEERTVLSVLDESVAAWNERRAEVTQRGAETQRDRLTQTLAEISTAVRRRAAVNKWAGK